MKYFPQEVLGEDQVKSIYKNLCKEYHPDKGGDAQAFIEMKIEYDLLIRRLSTGHDEEFNKDLIDDLWKHCEEQGYKKGWVYYKFVELGHDVIQSDFNYMAEVLEYAKGWAWHKWNEYDAERS